MEVIMKRSKNISILFVCVLLGACISGKLAAAPERQQVQSFEKTIYKEAHLNYLLYLPKEYGKMDKKWPMILFLHGVGESGGDPNLVTKQGLPKLIAQGKDFDFIIVSPQCPKNNWWSDLTAELNALVDDITARYEVDTSRLYVTGLSMGGFGTWSLIQKYPDKFAAAAPICGGGDTVMAKYRLAKMPIWVFHGAKDDIVPLSKAEEMVEALKKAGSQNVQFTVYPEAGHDSWTETYNNPQLYQWFLSHEKK
jgi:predicted peptidase